MVDKITPSQKPINFITNNDKNVLFGSVAVNAIVVKINVKDANVPLKFLRIFRKIWLQKKLTFIRITYKNAF